MPIIAAFFLGAVPSGWIVVRLLAGVDPRNFGSGNIGATNVFRLVGWTGGVLTLVVDVLKGVVPLVYFVDPDKSSPEWLAVIGFFSVLGHIFTPFLRFRGCKGVATAAGVIGVLLPLPFLLSLLFFSGIVMVSRTVSLASLGALLVLGCAVLFFPTPWPYRALVGGLVVLIGFRHRTNIVRLLQRKEAKLVS